MRYCRLVASAMLEEEAPQAAAEQAIIGSTRVVAIATRGSLHKRWQLHERWQSCRETSAREKSLLLPFFGLQVPSRPCARLSSGRTRLNECAIIVSPLGPLAPLSLSFRRERPDPQERRFLRDLPPESHGALWACLTSVLGPRQYNTPGGRVRRSKSHGLSSTAGSAGVAPSRTQFPGLPSMEEKNLTKRRLAIAPTGPSLPACRPSDTTPSDLPCCFCTSHRLLLLIIP